MCYLYVIGLNSLYVVVVSQTFIRPAVLLEASNIPREMSHASSSTPIYHFRPHRHLSGHDVQQHILK